VNCRNCGEDVGRYSYRDHREDPKRVYGLCSMCYLRFKRESSKPKELNIDLEM
jgi:NMD protein affecting ribosome stability and mRNA decay